MNDFRIPRRNSDLSELINLKCRKFAIKYGICIALILLAEVVFLFDVSSSRLGIANAIALAVILLIAPFFIFGGHRLLFDKQWEGKVLLIDYTSHTVYAQRSAIKNFPHGSKINIKFSFKGGRGSYTTPCETCEIYIETDSGKTFTYKTLLAPGDRMLPIEVGTRLRKYKGLPYPVILGNGKSECAVCGRVNEEDAKECIDCRYTIIKTD